MSKITKPQLFRAREFAEILHVSQRHIWRMKAAGKLPKAMEVGECVRWSLDDIEKWIAIGCPSQRQFEAFKAKQKRSN